MSDMELASANGIADVETVAVALEAAQPEPAKRTRKPRAATIQPPPKVPQDEYSALLAEAAEARRHAEEAAKAARSAGVQKATSLENQGHALLDEAARIRDLLGIEAGSKAKPGPAKATPKRARKPLAKAAARIAPKPSGTDVVSVIASAGKRGASSADLQSALGLPRDKARLAVQTAIEAGKVRATGKARGMRYFAR